MGPALIDSAVETDDEPLPSSFLGVFSDGIHAVDLVEHPVLGDGDCGFRVLGITRPQLVECILPLQMNVNARHALASEIRAAVLSDEIPDSIKPNVWKVIKQSAQLAWDTLENLMTLVKTHVDTLYPEALGLNQRVAWLSGQTDIAEEQASLGKALTAFEENNAAVDELCESVEAYVAYVNLYQIPKTLWLGYQSALLWARVSRTSLTIWKKNPEAVDELVPIHTYVDPEPHNTIHMLHTSGFTHFNLLEQTKVRNLAEETALIAAWNNTNKEWSLDHTLYNYGIVR